MKFIMYMGKGRGYFHDSATGAYVIRRLTGLRRAVGWLYELFH
jgi:hypothetical protein